MIRESSEDVFLRFEIRDTGIGMSKDAMSRIFEPFEQADTSTTRKYGGIGLGVVISRQIVVLMDCQMPEMDGYEATEAIRSHADERIRNTIVIAMTANAITGEKDRCLEVGMNDFVAKPVNMRTLSEVLERNLTFDRVLQTPRVRTPDEVRLAWLLRPPPSSFATADRTNHMAGPYEAHSFRPIVPTGFVSSGLQQRPGSSNVRETPLANLKIETAPASPQNHKRDQHRRQATDLVFHFQASEVLAGTPTDATGQSPVG